MAVQGVLVVWTEAEDAPQHAAAWSGGQVVYIEELSTPLLVEPEAFRGRVRLEAASGSAGATARRFRLPPELKVALPRGECLTAPFELPLCRGRVVLIGPRDVSDDDLLLTELIGIRFAVDLEHDIARRQCGAVAASAERARLARDLHDGVLQTLTAANLNLKLSSDQAPPDLAARLDDVRRSLVEEQQRVRIFLEDGRSVARPEASLALAADLAPCWAKLERDWGCKVDYGEAPPGIKISTTLAGHIRHLITEAVSNAARHGRASSAAIRVAAADASITLTISDNGRGFSDLAGHYDQRELRALAAGPRSLLARVEELGGELRLRTGVSGAAIRIELPSG